MTSNSYFLIVDMLAGLEDVDRLFEGDKLIYLCLPNDGDGMAYLGRYLTAAKAAEKEGRKVVAPYLARFVYDEDGNPKYSHTQIALMAKKLIERCAEVWVGLDRLAPNMVAEIIIAAKAGKKVMCMAVAEEDEEHE